MNFRGPADYPRSACRAWIVFAWCLLLGAGIETAREWFGCIGRPGNELRRILLAAGFSIYYVRILFTVFVFLKRGVSWSEAFTIAGWLLCIVMLLGIAGGTNSSAVGPDRFLRRHTLCCGIVDELLCGIRAPRLETAA
jgi:hypothetical protein